MGGSRWRRPAALAVFGAAWFGGLGLAGLPGDGQVQALDLRLGAWIEDLRGPAGIAFFTRATMLGDKEVIVALAIAFSALLWRAGRKQIPAQISAQISALWLVPIGASASTAWLKTLFARPRPDFALQELADFSFPSGHATGAVAFYGFLAWLALRRGWLSPAPALALGLGAAGLIGFSRLYLGVHYLSDVLGGYLVGGLWALAGAAWLKADAAARVPRPPSRPGP